jgi:hypothetical protein
MSERLFLVTTADPGLGPEHVGSAVFLRAADEPAALAEAAHVLLDETDLDVSTLSDAVVIAFDDLPDRWRFVIAGERVPDAFRCCGGSPYFDRPGTEDEHAATCPEAAA